MGNAWRRRGAASSRGECRLLVVDDDGPLVLRAVRTADRGVKVDGVFYPDELLRDVGCDTYQLATAVEMPADGDMSHNAPYAPLRVVGQLEWTAGWESYDQGRRRLNAAAVWDRGGDMGSLIKNAILAGVLIIGMFSGWTSLRVGSSAAELDSKVSDLNAALYRVIAPPALATPGVGAPTGDRVTPTVVKRP